MSITFVTGDATRPVGTGAKIIVHVCNDQGGWGKGFVVALSRRWPEPEREYRRWAAGDDGGASGPFALGQVQLVAVEPELWVANLVGQHGTRPSGGRAPVRYEAIREGLARVAVEARARAASVHMPRIGCGLAGGTWEEIEPLIAATLLEAGIAVTVYDLPA